MTSTAVLDVDGAFHLPQIRSTSFSDSFRFPDPFSNPFSRICTEISEKSDEQSEKSTEALDGNETGPMARRQSSRRTVPRINSNAETRPLPEIPVRKNRSSSSPQTPGARSRPLPQIPRKPLSSGLPPHVPVPRQLEMAELQCTKRRNRASSARSSVSRVPSGVDRGRRETRTSSRHSRCPSGASGVSCAASSRASQRNCRVEKRKRLKNQRSKK